MLKDILNVGDTITFTSEGMQGTKGIVSQPITEEKPGHVLMIRDGCTVGVEAFFHDIIPASQSSQCFTQLAYNLIKLGIHVIEKD